MNTLIVEYKDRSSKAILRSRLIAQDLADAAELLQLSREEVTIITSRSASSAEERAILATQKEGQPGDLFSEKSGEKVKTAQPLTS